MKKLFTPLLLLFFVAAMLTAQTGQSENAEGQNLSDTLNPPADTALVVSDTALIAADTAQAADAEISGTVFFDTTKINILVVILIMLVLLLYFISITGKGGIEKMYIRRIPGIDAIEEAIGRATEMGRPILYVPGIEDMTDIQTIASMLILGEVAKKVARYRAEILVPCRIPFVMTVAEEVVRQGYTDAGAPENHIPENIRYISDEQFAYAAGVNGIMLREKPAANLLLGKFFAESLILAETGFESGAIQVAGTAEATQLPFFIAACDYTIIGEELYAASAYLSRDSKLISNLKATDYYKLLIIIIILSGVIIATFQTYGVLESNIIHDFLQVK